MWACRELNAAANSRLQAWGIATGGTGADESKNLDGAGNADPVFVWHTPAPSDAANGEFDDQFAWITVGEFYGKLIASGMLP